MKSEYFLYILKCGDGSYYISITKDLRNRIMVHNNGQGAKFTATRRLASIVYKGCYMTLSKVVRREKQIKGWSRKKKENLIKGIWRGSSVG